MNSLELTALDRCDRCGAQAYVRVTLEENTELLFCVHHWREHRDAIQSCTAVKLVHDETEKISLTS